MPAKTDKQDSRFDRAVAIFRKHGGILRTAQALRAGIHPSTPYAMRDSGTLEAISRGVYRLANSEPPGNPDLVIVATRIQGGVICLISALAFPEIRKTKLISAPDSFEEVIGTVKVFLEPLAASIIEQRAFNSNWIAPGPWR